jgi:hypothetical protein
MCCVRVPDEDHPGKRLQEVQPYPAMTRSLLGMCDHLACLGVTRVVMEATSDYWKPVFYLLETAGSGIWLVRSAKSDLPPRSQCMYAILRVDPHDARLRFRARAAQVVTGELAQRVRDLVLAGIAAVHVDHRRPILSGTIPA